MFTAYGLPLWFEYLVFGFIIVYAFFVMGKILAKTGHSPLWSLVILVPFLQIVAIWAFAYASWPFIKTTEDNHG